MSSVKILHPESISDDLRNGMIELDERMQNIYAIAGGQTQEYLECAEQLLALYNQSIDESFSEFEFEPGDEFFVFQKDLSIFIDFLQINNIPYVIIPTLKTENLGYGDIRGRLIRIDEV